MIIAKLRLIWKAVIVFTQASGDFIALSSAAGHRPELIYIVAPDIISKKLNFRRLKS